MNAVPVKDVEHSVLCQDERCNTRGGFHMPFVVGPPSEAGLAIEHSNGRARWTQPVARPMHFGCVHQAVR